MKQKNKNRITALFVAAGIFVVSYSAGYFLNREDPIKNPAITAPKEDENSDNGKEPTYSLPSILETFIEETLPQEPTEEVEEKIEEPIPVPQNDIMYASTNLNLRTAPTTDPLIIGSLEIYDTVERLAEGPEWSLVRFNDQIAFANNYYLVPSSSTVDQTIQHTLKNDIVLTTSSLNFRKEPDKESERILTFDENTELQVLAETDNGWLLVKNNNQIGYVHKDYTISMLEMLNNIYPGILPELKLQKVVYASEELNIRAGNSIETEAIDILERLESVRVYGEFGDWYLIMTNNHNFGFVHKDYVKELDEEFVIVDLDLQTLYLYNGTDQYIKTPITSGKDSTPSDKGLFKIYYKSTNTPLIGDDYNVTVDYWMNYNNGEGLHDASWRSVFGTDSYHYNGSHGCINIPPYLADDVYEHTKKGTKVLVHK